MAGIALLARQLGYRVTGSDQGVYPPMSTQLQQQDIACYSGYEPEHLDPMPDCVVIGNAMTRGNPLVEHVLNQRIPFRSGPQWLAEHVLGARWVLAVAGTHGKTTTSSLVAWILEYAQLQPGFLIGGIPENFGVSARLGAASFFVVEADEYDTAFFDKRSKFIHYLPHTLIINNLEYDHADIFPNLAAIQQQFHHLVRTVPNQGLIIHNQQASIHTVLEQGCWTPCETFGTAQSDWTVELLNPTGEAFTLAFRGQIQGEVHWSLIGTHNVSNALTAIAAARHAGVPVATACAALSEFKNVKRRLELRGEQHGIKVYDDFAHHPTAIATTLAGLRCKIGSARLIAVLEPRSNTMKRGVHQTQLADALRNADHVAVLQPPNLTWSLTQALDSLPSVHIAYDTTALLQHLLTITQHGDHVVLMSNGAFDHLHQRLLDALAT